MIKYLLNCKNCSLEFESWFASSTEYDKLKKLKLLSCQQCNSQKIEKSLMKPNLANSNFKQDKAYKNYKNVKKKLREYQKFVKPENLENICNKYSLVLKRIDGVKFNPLLNKWKLSNDKSVNYITKFKKS